MRSATTIDAAPGHVMTVEALGRELVVIVEVATFAYLASELVAVCIEARPQPPSAGEAHPALGAAVFRPPSGTCSSVSPDAREESGAGPCEFMTGMKTPDDRRGTYMSNASMSSRLGTGAWLATSADAHGGPLHEWRDRIEHRHRERAGQLQLAEFWRLSGRLLDRSIRHEPGRASVRLEQVAARPDGADHQAK